MQSNVFRHLDREDYLIDKPHQKLIYRVCVSSFRDQLVLQFHQTDHDNSQLCEPRLLEYARGVSIPER